jgi:tRNA A-37 threonylcarbamoyl transferase component Bud32/tetratricopeptide (TPR) repeat protein
MEEHETQPSGADRGSVLSGIVAGRFLIQARIGAGGMGEVYRAEDIQLHRPVAIKRIRPTFRDNPIYRSRLMKEARHAGLLNDPHIAAVYDVLNDGKEIFLVMEFVEGKSLRDYVTERIAVDEFCRIARQCLEAVAVAHRHGIVHRDIKPENILITPEKQVKICDFGLARMTPREGANAVTVTQGISGTPAYMAPEVHLGSVLDPRSDVFSLGTVLFELWTGQRPFSEKAFLQSSELSAAPPQPAAVRPGLNRAYNYVIRKMLSFSPADRYADAAQVLEDLERIETGAPERKKRVHWVQLLIMLSVLVVAGWIGSRFVVSPPAPDVGPPSLLLADFENKSGDAYYDLTVSQLFGLAMEQSQYLNVMSRNRVLQAMARSGVRPGSTVTLPIALEIAKREHTKFVLAGEVQRQANRILLVLHAANSNSGREAKVFRAEFGGASELPLAVQNLASGARLWLGEPSTRMNATNLPLDQVTTRSAIAWERFSRALQMDSLGTQYVPDAATLIKSAIEVDPDFALAHEKLAALESRLGNLNDSLASIRRAYELSDRVTDREKYTIIGQYHNIRWEFDAALKAFRTLVLLYPYDDVGHLFYAQALSNALQTKEAIAQAQAAVALNPGAAVNRGTLAIVLALDNRNDEVISMITELRKNGVTSLDNFEANAWLGKGDFERARAIFEKIGAQPESQGSSGRFQVAKTLIYEGRLEEAAAKLESDLTTDLQLRDERLIVQRRNWLAWIRALQGNRTAASSLARSVLQVDLGPTHVHDLQSLGILAAEMHELGLAEEVVSRLDGFVKAGYEGGFFTSAAAQIRAEIARARGENPLAVRYAGEASVQWMDVLTLWTVARVSENAGDFRRALSAYREIITREGEIIRTASNLPALKSLALAGAARCEVVLGNRDQAREDYDRFFRTLGMHSPELMVVRTAAEQRQSLN